MNLSQLNYFDVVVVTYNFVTLWPCSTQPLNNNFFSSLISIIYEALKVGARCCLLLCHSPADKHAFLFRPMRDPSVPVHVKGCPRVHDPKRRGLCPWERSPERAAWLRCSGCALLPLDKKSQQLSTSALLAWEGMVRDTSIPNFSACIIYYQSIRNVWDTALPHIRWHRNCIYQHGS